METGSAPRRPRSEVLNHARSRQPRIARQAHAPKPAQCAGTSAPRVVNNILPAFTIRLLGDAGPAVLYRAAAGQSLVKSAALAGVRFTTGCLQGRCAICRARLVEGAVTPLRRPSPHATSNPATRPDGCVLMCSIGPLSDLVLEPLSPWELLTTAAPR